MNIIICCIIFFSFISQFKFNKNVTVYLTISEWIHLSYRWYFWTNVVMFPSRSPFLENLLLQQVRQSAVCPGPPAAWCRCLRSAWDRQSSAAKLWSPQQYFSFW